MESLLVQEEVLSRKSGITAVKGHNFWSESWMTLIFFTVVSEDRFPCITYGLPTRWRGGIAMPDQKKS